jgi:hypothetical protein
VTRLSVEAGCHRWADFLGPHRRDAKVRLAASLPWAVGKGDGLDDDGDRAPSPGPGGDLIFSLNDGCPAWAPWGRPQPGMFVGRLTALLGSGGIRRDTEQRARRWADRGVTMAEVVGRDPVNRNVALRPHSTSARLDAWGDGQTWLHGVRAVFDAKHHRIDMRADRWPGVGLPLYSSLATIGGYDPGSLLLRTLSMGHGWEWVSMGFPALPVERDEWHHLPRLELDDGTVLSPRRWNIEANELTDVIGRTGADRYLAWRRLADRVGLPARVHVRWDLNPNVPPFLLCGDSPLAVDAVFDRVDSSAPRLIVTETGDDAGRSPVVDDQGRHYAAELAVTWWDESWPESATERALDLREAVG